MKKWRWGDEEVTVRGWRSDGEGMKKWWLGDEEFIICDGYIDNGHDDDYPADEGDTSGVMAPASFCQKRVKPSS